MTDRELRTYLSISEEEFEHLLRRLPPARLEAYRALAAVSDNLEQLPSRYNRPPVTADDDPVHLELEARSAAAFAALDALIKAHEEFRRARADGAQRPRNGRRGRWVVEPDMGEHCIPPDVARRLAAKVRNLGQGA